MSQLPTTQHKSSLGKKLLLGFALLLLTIVLVVHTFLAGWLLGYVNKVLGNINGYQGHAESIAIDLYRGAYRINGLVINKKNGKIPVPFLAIVAVDFSLQWSALLHGRIVSDATLLQPTLNFAVKEQAVQNGTEADWTQAIKDLMPIDINHVVMQDGSITYRDFSSTPQVNIFIHHMNGEILNLRNVVDPLVPLPSTLHLTGASIGHGKLRLDGRLNILKRFPDMDMLLALENVNLPALNSYSEAYAAFDFRKGVFNLYGQLTIKDGKVGGYVKPLSTGFSVDILKNANPLRIIWNTLVAGVLEIFSNQTHDQFATRVDLTGSLDNIETDTWSTLGGIIRNAFVEAMRKGFDKSGQDAALTKEKE